MNKKRQLTVCAVALLLTVLTGVLAFSGVLTAKDATTTEAAVLKQGSTGSSVRTLQTKLKSWGYYTGSVDGIYGSQTVKAVKYFQSKNGLAVDGIVGAKTAAALGMTHTSFANPSGLDAQGHYSCALDMARLAAYAMREPTFARIAATRTAAVGERMLGNHNKLLASLEGCTGLKTGYTDNAGRTLVTGCERDGMRLIAVTLNDRSDWADHAALYEYGFAAFARKRAVARGEEYTLAPVRGGTQTSVLLAAGEELLVSARLPEELTAPLTAGQAVGELIVSMDGEELARVPLVCAEPVAAAEKKQSLFERLFDRTG